MYQLYLHPKVKSLLKELDGPSVDIIKSEIQKLKTNPKKGKKVKYSNFRRLTVGDCGIIYEINEKEKHIIEKKEGPFIAVPWCPKCHYYKGKSSLCPHCMYHES